jgi:hypothetical protein
MVKKRKNYSCDFETTTEIDDCRVWAYGWMEIGNKTNYNIGNNMEDFMKWLEKCNGNCYFHNLKFDGSFIVNYLLKNGFKYDHDASKEKSFNAIVSHMGVWYAIDICWGYTKDNKRKHTQIYDSLKKLPFTVKQIARSFKLEIRKGDIDYRAKRPIGHEITEEEYAYIKNDIEIVADALKVQFDQGLTKMTSGSDSLEGFKNIISKKAFKKLFPVLDLEADKDIRYAYRGGFTWVNDRFKGKAVGEGMVFDVNSLYPSQMYERLLPFGMPVPFKGKYETNPDYPLYIQHVKCEFELKENYIPTIQIKDPQWKHIFAKNEYLKSSKGYSVDLYLTNIDLELIQEHYEIYNLEYIDGCMFRGRNDIFRKFIDKWMHIKVTSKGAIKQLAKLMLNSLYGKFATNPKMTGRIPFVKKDGALGFGIGEEEYRDPIYTAMGVFITSWARYTTITTAQKCFDRILYCDTDSIHILGTEIPEVIKDVVDPNKLGYWKHESTFKRAKFLKQKTYVEDIYAKIEEGDIVIENDEYTIRRMKKEECEPQEATTTILNIKCSGMSDKAKEYVTFENFEINLTVKGNLKSKQVNGGVVLIDDEFTIKAS